MPAASRNDHNTVIRKINRTLQGPVVEALGELVPEVKRLPKRGALEAIMDDIDLLHRCFLAFRAKPEYFGHLLVDRHKVAVEDAEALLECGRSLDQVVAMVVRTAAKRHFRRRLDGNAKSPRARTARRPRRNLLARIKALLAAPHPASAEPRTRAEILYDAVSDYLRHDWQVPIIPEYCQMSPGLVRRLGPRLLEYRIPEDIRRLRADPDNPPPPTPVVQVETPAPGAPAFQLPGLEQSGGGIPGAITGTRVADERVSDGMAKLELSKDDHAKDERARLSDILTADGKRLKANAFTVVLLDPKVRAVLPDSQQTVRITGILGAVNGSVGKHLVGELGFRVDQLAVFLMAAHGALGDTRFEKAFGVPGRPDYILKIVAKAKAANLEQQSSLADIASFVARLFAAAEAAGGNK